MPHMSRYLSMLPRISPEHLPELYPDTYPISLTRPYPIVYPTELHYPDLFPTRVLPTRSYLATLPNILTRLGNTSLPRLLTKPYPITFPGRVPFNWPYPKTSSSASHLDLGLFRLIIYQDCSNNPKPTWITLKQSR
jgi:hypothetical protein